MHSDFLAELVDGLADEHAGAEMEPVGENLYDQTAYHDHPAPAAFRVVVLLESQQLSELGHQAPCLGLGPWARSAAPFAEAANSRVSGEKVRQ